MATNDALGDLPYQVVVRYSQRGHERAWRGAVSSGIVEEDAYGPAEVLDLKRRFVSSMSNSLSPELVSLRIVPVRQGASSLELAPVAAQRLLEFLQRFCQQDDYVFQLRAVLRARLSEDFLQVRVVFPGTVPASNTADIDPSTLPIEHFECRAKSDVAALKQAIQERMQFPADSLVLVIGSRRLHDELPMARVAALGEAGGMVIQAHVAASGAYVFLRREGQGHLNPCGPCTLTLQLPSRVHGAHERPMPFDLTQSLSEMQWAIQSVSGLPPACLHLELIGKSAKSLAKASSTETLGSLGFSDGCVLQVSHNFGAKTSWQECCDFPLDVSTVGPAEKLYECAASALGVVDTSRLALFVGNTAIDRSADTCCSMLADGVVVSAFMARPLQLLFSVLPQRFGVGKGASSNASGACLGEAALPASSSSSFPSFDSRDDVRAQGAGAGLVPCLSSDTVAEVRDQVMAVTASADSELAAQLRTSQVFAVDSAAWQARAGEVTSLAALARMLRGFVPLPDSCRLSCLGIADGKGHLVFVPQRQFVIEVEVHIGGEPRTTRTLRCPSTAYLRDLANRLERDLEDIPIDDCPLPERGVCQWALARTVQAMAAGQQTEEALSEREAGEKPTSSGGLFGSIGVGRRKSFGSSDAPNLKRRKSLTGAAVTMAELSHDEFVGDLLAHHAAEPEELASQFLCPISYEVMNDPVLVVGSGNTYDRKSIERHFERKKTDPLANTELTRLSDRVLVPNNVLRSQIAEMVRAQVHLKLAALYGERRQTDSPMVAYLKWCGTLLRGGSTAAS